MGIFFKRLPILLSESKEVEGLIINTEIYMYIGRYKKRTFYRLMGGKRAVGELLWPPRRGLLLGEDPLC